MGTTLVCQQCGAPWQPDITGACRFCRVVAPPPGAPSGVGAGRPHIDGDALTRVLLSLAAAPSHPLDRLATALSDIAGDLVRTTGCPVSRIQVSLDDWKYQAWVAHDDPQAEAVHSVRGVVLKHQPLPFDEWLACVAGHLAEYAGTHRRVRDAIVAIKEAPP